MSTSLLKANSWRVGGAAAGVIAIAVAIVGAAPAQAATPTPGSHVSTSTGEVRRITRDDWPGRSLPIHPTQLYSALDAALMALILWFAYPFRRRDGEIFALLITIYPITRFLLEVVRSDEPGQFAPPVVVSAAHGHHDRESGLRR